MKTRDIVSILLKSAGIGLISTTTAVGGIGMYSSIANTVTSIPEDGNDCLAVLEDLRKLDTTRVLWSLLAFAPGFLFGSLYFLCRLPGSVCPSQASEYETIDDNDETSCIATSFNEMSNFFRAVFLSDNPFKVLLKAIIAGLSVLGLLYGIVTVSTTNIDRKVFLPEECQEDLRGDIILDLTLNLIILVMVCGPILLVGCGRACSPKTETPAQLVGERQDDPASSGEDSNRARVPHVNEDKSAYQL
jgi:hypothetical protein